MKRIERIDCLTNGSIHIWQRHGCTIDDESDYCHLNLGYRCAAASTFLVIDPAGQTRTYNHSPQIQKRFLQPDIHLNCILKDV